MFRKITYTDKEDILGLVSIDNKNKVTAQDMNDIKNAINDNTQELDRIMVHVAGDTMTGALNFKANTWNKYGSNVAVGAINTAGTLAVKGLDGKTTIRLVPNGATDNNGVTWTANSATDSTISGTLNGSFKGPLDGNAATTTKLQTARTINDTSFNGTANITTAKWGTARNIYIADSDATNTGAAVSVNGSGNATLKLPATIKASLIGNAATATKLATARTIALTGSVTGSGTFDGSGNLSIATTTNHTHAYLPTAGGSMTGNINFNGRGNNYIGAGPRDGAGGVGEELNNLVISAWYGVSFTTLCDGEYKNKNAVSINTRTGHVYANTYHGALSGNASTATTLQNSRKINGTSFNGSADITTDKWGTARNISISDSTGANTGTAVSVNGGTNATLKLPSTIVATLSGNASSADSVRTPRVAPGNFNDIPTKERTIFKEYSDSSSNIPSNHWYYGMTLQGADINYTTQLALGMTTEQLHYRTRQGGNWGQWKKLGFAPFSTTAIAYAGWWGGGAAPYTCTISIPKVTSSNIVEVGLGSSANDDQVKACMKASIAKITQANGSITLYAYGTKPTVDIPLSIVVMEN